jgi:hypothetical protein
VKHGSSALEPARLNAAVEDAFASGLRAVLIDFAELRVSAADVSVTASDDGADYVVLIGKAFGVQEGDGRLRRFLGPCFFAEHSQTWSRAPGYRYGDEGEHETGPGAVCGIDAILVPHAAWTRVGRLDARLPAGLGALDWTTRALAAGLRCRTRTLECVGGPTVLHSPETGVGDEAVAGAYRLAWKHHLPCGAAALFGRRAARALAGSYARTRFWTDYGVPVGPSRRIYWYLRNLGSVRRLAAVGRECVALAQAVLPRRGMD